MTEAGRLELETAIQTSLDKRKEILRRAIAGEELDLAALEKELEGIDDGIINVLKKYRVPQ